jgi:hypothetical protein
MIVLDERTVILFRGDRVLASGLYKTQDSFVEPAHESVPTNLKYERKTDWAPLTSDGLQKVLDAYRITRL